MKNFYLYGERCSGTNVIQKLIEINTSYRVAWDHGYKHWPKQRSWDDVLEPIVLVTRNPFDYFKSLYRKPWHAPDSIKNLSFEDFLRAEWWNIYDEEAHILPGDELYGKERMEERHPKKGRRFKNVIEMRTEKLRYLKTIYLSKAPKVSLVSFEDMIIDQKMTVKKILRDWGEGSNKRIKIIKSYKGSATLKRRTFNILTFYMFQKNVVTRGGDLSKNSEEYIRSNLDPELEAFFRYR